MWRALLAASVIAACTAGPAAARGADYCCVNAGLSASYDSSSKRISAHWQAAPSGVTPVELRAGDRLGADGVVDSSSPRFLRLQARGTGGSFGAGRLALVLDSHGGVFVQVRFSCSPETGVKACASGAFWSRPLQITADDSVQAGKASSGSSPLEVVSTNVHLTSNGTQACLDAWNTLKGVIAQVSGNTAAAKRARDAGASTAPYAKKQVELMKLFERDYKAAKAACAKS